jgi:hypothetical protein
MEDYRNVMKVSRKKDLRTTSHSHQKGSEATPKRDFESTMAEVTQEMPGYKRYFSTFIHSKPIWAVSDILSRTIARPNAILFGAILSFAVTISVYLLSKNFGYSLSGFESIAAFLIGWLAGIIFDVFSSLLKRKD